MIYAGILAGGIGKRFGSNIPKQFLLLNNKPLLCYSINAFLKCNYINKIIIALPKKHFITAKHIIEKNFSTLERRKIILIYGGTNRTISLLNICKYILNTIVANSNPILITHDGDRPFITKELIDNNIIELGINSDKIKINTVAIPTTDTIYNLNSNQILERNKLYNIQTPQTFYLWSYLELFYKLYPNFFTSNEEIMNDVDKLVATNKLTDATALFTQDNQKIGITLGYDENIKITTPLDLKIAEQILHNKLLKEQ